MTLADFAEMSSVTVFPQSQNRSDIGRYCRVFRSTRIIRNVTSGVYALRSLCVNAPGPFLLMPVLTLLQPIVWQCSLRCCPMPIRQ